MNARSRFGIVLLLIGIYWLASYFFPILTRLTNIVFSWPFLMIIIGCMILFRKSNRK